MSGHHDRWRNGEGQRWRKRIAATLPQPCCRCGRPVRSEDEWEADHLIPLASVPQGVAVPQLIRPAHKSCNRRAGGRDGARITNARKRAQRNDEKGMRPW